MKKTMICAAALLMASVVMTACSGGDDVTSDVTPVSQPAAEAGDVVELSGTLGGKSSTTRAIAENGTGTWEVGDRFAVYYETANGHASAVATVNSVNDDKSANFTASLHSPKAGDNSVKLVYPASAHDGQGGFKTDGLMKQGGTLEYINKNGLDIETYATTMNVEGMTAKLKENVTMQPQVCLYTLNPVDYQSTALPVTKLEISDNQGHSYTITPTEATNSLTVALLPVTSANFTFTATTAVVGRIYTKQDVTLANCTATNVGDVIFADGNIYRVSNGSGVIYSESFSGKKLEAGKFYSQSMKLWTLSAVAMIAYVGGNGSVETGSSYRGLAIAMNDCTQYNTNSWPSSSANHANWCSQKGTTCTTEYSTDVKDAREWKDGISMTTNLVKTTTGHNHWAAKAARNYKKARPSGTTEWFLPSLGQWQLIIQGLISKVDNEPYTEAISLTDNNKMKSSYIGSVIINAGASSNNPLGLEYCYWSSSEYDTQNGWIVGFGNGNASPHSKVTTFSTHVRPVLAF